jgi:myo-inositol catabolism protein IolC
VADAAPRGYPHRLYLLAFDHRASFTRDLFGIPSGQAPGEAQVAQVSDAKMLIFEGFQRALAKGAPKALCGILVGEDYGAEVARAARREGVTLAMPVEASGKKVFELEYGDDFGAHVEAFDPDLVKVLVRYNPAQTETNAVQVERLAPLSAWLREHDRRLLFELLVPATPEQLRSVGGDQDRYDLELRPDLLLRTIDELQRGGVEPDIWKIEGLDRREDCERVVARVRQGGRERVACVVLGRGASHERVRRWLTVAAPVEGFQGFAIGRTIWLDALHAFRDGAPREETVARIGDVYLEAIQEYASAAESG